MKNAIALCEEKLERMINFIIICYINLCVTFSSPIKEYIVGITQNTKVHIYTLDQRRNDATRSSNARRCEDVIVLD